MSNDTYTEDLSDIMQCSRERHLVADIMNAWNTSGLPDTFYDDGVKFAFNRNSGNVFLVNSDYQCAMMNGDKLQVFHSMPYSGYEGFIEDLLEEYAPYEMHADDAEYVLDVARGEGAELPDAWRAFANSTDEE